MIAMAVAVVLLLGQEDLTEEASRTAPEERRQHERRNQRQAHAIDPTGTIPNRRKLSPRTLPLPVIMTVMI